MERWVKCKSLYSKAEIASLIVFSVHYLGVTTGVEGTGGDDPDPTFKKYPGSGSELKKSHFFLSIVIIIIFIMTLENQ